MKKNLSKLICSLLPIISILSTSCFSDNIKSEYSYHIGNPEYVSGINLPGLTDYNRKGGNELLILAKQILSRAIEYLPMLVLILLLLACVKIIFDGDGKAGFKRIKYILIGIGLMILSIYVINILSTIFFGHPVLNINFHRQF